MIKNPKTVLPSMMLTDAIKTMRDNRIGCLPVVNEGGELVGIITEMDFLRISVRLIEK
jgi:CBS domain-containing protein